MRTCPTSVWFLVGVLLLKPGSGAAQAPADFSRWEKTIAAFEKQDQEKPPPKNAVLFVGSSSIRLWDLKKSFPELTTINRGFGGSQIADAVHFAPPAHPQACAVPGRVLRRRQ